MDSIDFMGRKIPIYGIMGFVGIILAILYLWIICRRRKKNFEDSIYIFIWACIFAMVGAKLLYLFTEADRIVSLICENHDQIKNIIIGYLSGGFVFYGGLIGAIIGVVIVAKYFSLIPLEELNFCTPLMPLVHGFGRIGCHLVGCCYGIEYSGPLARIYSHSAYAPNEIGLFPVQLVESVFDFALLIILSIPGFYRKFKDIYIYIYLLSYSVIRFTLEFLRGDSYRGFFAGLSTSQWISILIFISVICILTNKAVKRRVL